MSNSGNERLMELAGRLLSLTRQGKIHWSQGEASSYEYSTATSSVLVSNDDEDGRHPFTLEVYNDSGNVVDQLKTGYTATHMAYAWNDLIEELYTVARRDALDIDKVLDEILAQLPTDEDPA